MPERRRKFSPQFRAEAVQLVIETSKPIADVARDLGVDNGRVIGRSAHISVAAVRISPTRFAAR